MRCEADVLNGHLRFDLLLIVVHAWESISFLEIAGDGALCTISSDDDSVAGVMAPSLEESSGLAVLEHAWSAHDNHGVIFLMLDPLLAPEVVDVLILEGIPGFLVELFLNLETQHVDVSFVNLLALVDQLDRVVDPDVFELLNILIPELIQDKQ